MCETWPPLDTVLQKARRAVGALPPELVGLLEERYRAHGLEYATAERRDGLPVNACMSKDNLLDVEEEIVDAVFNATIYAYRDRLGDRSPLLLSKLIDAWEFCASLQREQWRRSLPPPAP